MFTGKLVNFGLIGSIIGLVIAALTFTIQNPKTISLFEPEGNLEGIPKNSFAALGTHIDALGKGILTLDVSPPTMQLPDLRQTLTYYGRNGRPDAPKEKASLHFSTSGSRSLGSVSPGDPLYLIYQDQQYSLSPNNAETSLWISSHPNQTEASIQVHLSNENGDMIHGNTPVSLFKLTQKEFPHVGQDPWEIGKWRVDGTLLARQRARWYGSDCFLERHGGHEFHSLAGKQRIDFTDDEDTYTVYVGLNDVLLWNQNHWEAADEENNTQKVPVMVVKKIDGRLMSLELWDVDGQRKVHLNLLKCPENFSTQNIQADFKFIGSRTRTQFLFDVHDQRLLIKPKDWLLLTEEGWKKLSTSQEIDDFVSHKMAGLLLVIDEIGRKDDRQVLFATLFNPNRTEMQTVALPMQPSGTLTEKKPSKKGRKKAPELVKEEIFTSDFDDDDDDDDFVFN